MALKPHPSLSLSVVDWWLMAKIAAPTGASMTTLTEQLHGSRRALSKRLNRRSRQMVQPSFHSASSAASARKVDQTRIALLWRSSKTCVTQDFGEGIPRPSPT